MKINSVLLVLFVFISGQAFTSQTNTPDQLDLLKKASITYSWSAVMNKISYEVEIENQTTFQKYSKETVFESATFENAPSGTYHIIVTAKMTDGSTSIIIEDESVL